LNDLGSDERFLSMEAPMKSGFRRRLWVELVAASLAVGLCLITQVQPDWVERALGLDPDGHAGWLETVISGGAVLAAAGAVAATALEWRRDAARVRRSGRSPLRSRSSASRRGA
jgi:hypothetical protein